MPRPVAIEGFADASQARVMVWQSEREGHVPATGLGLLPSSSVSAYMLTLLDDANAAAARATLGLGSAATDEMTDWVAYTPTFTGFGTVSGVSIWSRRIGDTLRLRGKFTAGTSTAVEAQMTLGFNGSNANVTSDATKVPSIQMAGAGTYSNAGAAAPVVLIESSVGYVTFGLQTAGAGGLTKALGNGFLASGGVFAFTAEIPIAGW
jgi:hypothetical protein